MPARRLRRRRHAGRLGQARGFWKTVTGRPATRMARTGEIILCVNRTEARAPWRAKGAVREQAGLGLCVARHGKGIIPRLDNRIRPTYSPSWQSFDVRGPTPGRPLTTTPASCGEQAGSALYACVTTAIRPGDHFPGQGWVEADMSARIAVVVAGVFLAAGSAAAQWEVDATGSNASTAGLGGRLCTCAQAMRPRAAARAAGCRLGYMSVWKARHVRALELGDSAGRNRGAWGHGPRSTLFSTEEHRFECESTELPIEVSVGRRWLFLPLRLLGRTCATTCDTDGRTGKSSFA